MLSDEVNVLIFARELLSSLRSTNVRIAELRLISKNNWCSELGRAEIIERIDALILTKNRIISSIYKIRERLITCFAGQETAFYEDLLEEFKQEGFLEKLNAC